jgi:hypothetical protein
LHEQYQLCIEACQKCAVECEHCATACLQEPDAAARARCVLLLRDCADICVEAARWMGRGSSYANKICGLCADICDACAAECAKFKDQHCQRCAEECLRCAEECRKMAGMAMAGV